MLKADIVAVSAGRGRWGGSDTGLLVSVLLAAAVWCWWFGWRGSLRSRTPRCCFATSTTSSLDMGLCGTSARPLSTAQPIGLHVLARRRTDVRCRCADSCIDSQLTRVLGRCRGYVRLRATPPDTAGSGIACVRPLLPQPSGGVDTRRLRCGVLRCIDGVCRDRNVQAHRRTHCP